MAGGRAFGYWLVGGALGVAMLVALAWFLAIGPRYDERERLRTEASDARVRSAQLRKSLSELAAEDITAYRAQLAQGRAALPQANMTAELVSQLRSSASAAGVSVDTITFGGATELKAKGTTIYALPVSVSATGTVDELRAFLRDLQSNVPRALLVSQAGLAGRQSATLTGEVELTLGAQAFVAPPDTTD